jgi:hypothetical protein
MVEYLCHASSGGVIFLEPHLEKVDEAITIVKVMIDQVKNESSAG